MTDHDEKRRELLKTAARWLMLPIAAAGVARMATRKGETCDADFFCSRCRASGTCRLPQALSFRLESREKQDG